MKLMHTVSLAALCALAADDALAAGAALTAEAPAAAPSTVVEFEFPNLDGKQSFDLALIPPPARFDFLTGAVRAYIANRLNGVHTRHQKDEKVMAWAAYDAATKADALQTVVAKPEGERPSEPDYAEAYSRAIKDLTDGTVRRQSAEPKAKKVRDPLTSVVTEVVAREVFESKRAADPKYTYIKAKADVGTDGIAYLNTLIDAKVAAAETPEAGAALRAQLEKMRDTKYINPAKAMLGLNVTKAVSDLPSIL